MIELELTSSIFILKILKSKQNFDFEIEFFTRNKNEFRNRKFIWILNFDLEIEKNFRTFILITKLIFLFDQIN